MLYFFNIKTEINQYLLLKTMNAIMESDSPLWWICIQQTRSGINFWNKNKIW